MPPSRVFCRKCSEHHDRPVGRNCKRGQVSDMVVNAVSVNGPPESDNASVMSALNPAPLTADMGNRILSHLTSINDKFTTLESRVRMAETATANRATEPAALTPTVSDAQSVNVATPNLSVGSDIIPTPEFLKSSTVIQNQVDGRFLELQNAQVNLGAGKLKSQRGGADVPIKKFVAWPQHYVFVGPEKRRPTYDQIDPHVANCVWA